VDEFLQASIYLKGILPVLEEVVAYDQQAAAAIAGETLVMQLEVKGGPAAHMEIGDGQIRHKVGRHPHPDIWLTFATPDRLNRLFAGENVRPGIRRGFTRLRFLTNRFPILAGRLSYYLEGEGQQAQGPGADRFLVNLRLHAMLSGMAAVASDDRSLADTAASTPPGTLLVRVQPDGPHGTFAKVLHNGSYSFVATFGQPEGHPNALMEFGSLDVARRLLDGQLSAVVAIGTGEMRIRGYLPLIEKANIFLGRFARLTGKQ
jgi:hypothetical protein